MTRQTTYPSVPAVAVAGDLACRYEDAEIKAAFNDEASAEIPFGRAVMYGSATDGNSAKLPVAETAKIMGIVVRSHSYECGPRGELGTTGVIVGGNLEVLQEGEIWVLCNTGCAPGEKLWVRGVSSGTNGEALGNCENADDSTDTVDCTAHGMWQTYAAAGGLAKLRVNF